MRVRYMIKKGSVIAIIAIVFIIGAIVVGYMVSTKTMRTAYDMRINSLEEQIATNTHTVYVAVDAIPAGKVIEEHMVREEQHLITYTGDLFTGDDIGRMTLISIPQNTVLTKSVVTMPDNESTSREVEYTCLYLSATLEKGNYIDVRIRYHNGEDFVVVPKKQIQNISHASTSCHLIVSEIEQQMMASAIIDVEEYNAVLYTVAYVEPSVQEASSVTYPVRSEMIPLIFGKNTTESSEWLIRRGELELQLIREDDGNLEKGSIEISNFSEPRGKEYSNKNDSGMMGAALEEADEE